MRDKITYAFSDTGKDENVNALIFTAMRDISRHIRTIGEYYEIR